MARGVSLLGATFSLLVCGLLVCSSPASAQEADDHRRDKTETDGLALGGGLGTQYGGVGLQVAYYVQMPQSLFRLAPYVGAGLLGCRGDGEQSHCAFGYALGVQGSWGHKHRVTLNLSYATVGATTLYLHGQVADMVTVQGIGLAIGYEWMAFSGFIFRVEIGVAHAFLPSLAKDLGPWAPTLTLLGLGYKF